MFLFRLNEWGGGEKIPWKLGILKTHLSLGTLHIESEVDFISEQMQSLDLRVMSYFSQLFNSLKNECDTYLYVEFRSVCCENIQSKDSPKQYLIIS